MLAYLPSRPTRLGELSPFWQFLTLDIYLNSHYFPNFWPNFSKQNILHWLDKIWLGLFFGHFLLAIGRFLQNKIGPRCSPPVNLLRRERQKYVIVLCGDGDLWNQLISFLRRQLAYLLCLPMYIHWNNRVWKIASSSLACPGACLKIMLSLFLC
jgi:hypothetical protein